MLQLSDRCSIKVGQFIGLLLLLFSFGCKSQQFEIVKIDILSYDTISKINGGVKPIKGEVYLVRGYRDNEICNNKIDSFVRGNADTNFLASGHSYQIQFFKESSETNLKKINFLKWRVIDRHSLFHDAICSYKLMKEFYIRNKYINGNAFTIDDKDKKRIKVKELPID
jgi:hypothetical protein